MATNKDNGLPPIERLTVDVYGDRDREAWAATLERYGVPFRTLPITLDEDGSPRTWRIIIPAGTLELGDVIRIDGGDHA